MASVSVVPTARRRAPNTARSASSSATKSTACSAIRAAAHRSSISSTAYASKQDRLLGYWSFSATIADGDALGPQTLGEYLLFDSHYTAADGTIYVSGAGFVNTAVTALGTYSEADQTFSVDVTLPDGTLHHYEVQGDDTLLIGQSSYGASEPTPAIATRIEYYAPQLQGTTPASMFGLPAHATQR